jgi:hypothetical protein
MKKKDDGADGTLRCECGKEMSEYDASERFRTLIRQKTALFYDENSALNTKLICSSNFVALFAMQLPTLARFFMFWFNALPVRASVLVVIHLAV